jgi:hypothetical protein
MSGAYVVRPLSDRTWLRASSQRKPTRFDSPWRSTEQLLLAEVEHLDGRDLVIECDIHEQDLRLDGTLRANAREAATPAVVVAFESAQHGPMLYRCDTFFAPYRGQGPDWQHNVRSIALTLQALRSVDRYGATETGQQYAGFKALPAGRAMPASHMTADEAWRVLVKALGHQIAFDERGDAAARRAAVRRARGNAHPDRHGGDRTLWDQVEQAARVLGVSA